MPQAVSSENMAPTIDRMAPQDALAAMLASHRAATDTVLTALPQIEQAARIVADALTNGATLFYAAAGSSGLMALADACELPGTFGVPQTQLRICMAGGVPTDGTMPGATEDDHAAAKKAAAQMRPGDIAIVLSASGTTPYALAFANTARAQGNTVIAIANVPDTALLHGVDVAIALPTAPEVLGGSTRLGAGTAQKVALNMISTLAGVMMGHVHDGLMVNLLPDNIKLQKRAAAIVARIAGVSDPDAQAALTRAGNDTKLAILIANGSDITTARAALQAAGGRLRDCLTNTTTNEKT